METDKHFEHKVATHKQQEPRAGRSRVGAKLAKILLGLIAAALCLADAIECVLWGVSVIPCLLLFAAGSCFCIAAWFFLGYELGLYYDKQEKKVTRSEKDPLSRQANNRGGWLLLLAGTLLFGCAILTGNIVPLGIFYALLMS